jgi:trimeric autotransporter adhesin
MLSIIHSLILAQSMNLNAGVPTIRMADGGIAARIWLENAPSTTVNVSGGGSGGSGAPVDGGYLTLTAGSTGSTNEVVLTAGSNIAITPGSGTATVAVTGTVPNATAAVTATTATTATTAGSATTAGTASALASNPLDCSAGQFATTIAANGDLTCSQVATNQLSGSITDAQLASNYSGVGACGANQYATTLNDNGAPTCAQVAYSQVTGTPAIPADISSASYITKVAEGSLSNEFAMGSLATGIVKNTTTTGVPTIAVSGTDYAPATSGSAILKGNGAGGFSSAVSGTDYEPAGTYSGVGACGANQFATTLNDTAAPTCTQPSFTNLSGSATTGQLPTIPVTKGGSNLTTVAANQLFVGTAADTFTAKTVPDCDDSAGNHLNFDNATQTFTCGTTSSGGGGAPTTATYITQTSDATLTNEQALSALSTGLVKVTTGTGVLSTAVSGTDYNIDATGAVTGGVRLTGDLGGTATSPSVVDDSHNHTGATISALDTADITSGTLPAARGGLGAAQPTCSGGDFLTCNGTTCSCATPSGGGGSGLTHAEVQRLVFLGQ